MPKVSETFQSSGDWLKVDDLQGKARRVTVDSVELIHVKSFDDPNVKKPKFAVHLKETDKVYISNVSSARAIAAAYGDDTDGWIGKRIVLRPTMYPNGHAGIAGEPADIEVSEGFDNPMQIANEIAQQKRVDVPKDDFDDIPF